MKIQTPDIDWNVRVDGDSGSPPLVMLHGFAQTLNSFDPLIGELSKRYRILRVDLPYHGQSVVTKNVLLDWSVLCGNLYEAVFQLDKRPAHWFGYSQGGRVALMCAMRTAEPMRSLALLGASPGYTSEGERDMRRQSDKLLGENIVGRGMEWFTSYWEALPIFATQRLLPDSARRLIHSERMASTPQGLRLALITYGTGTMPDCSGELSNWKKPLFLAAGELDTKFVESNARIAASTYSSHLRHHVIKNCGHAAHLEKPVNFAELLIEFYKSQRELSHE
jgi:2-succinyl-6-hydroxy-2,4-cyclohexadiene-1-carboxylate synthase